MSTHSVRSVVIALLRILSMIVVIVMSFSSSECSHVFHEIEPNLLMYSSCGEVQHVVAVIVDDLDSRPILEHSFGGAQFLPTLRQ